MSQISQSISLWIPPVHQPSLSTLRAVEERERQFGNQGSQDLHLATSCSMTRVPDWRMEDRDGVAGSHEDSHWADRSYQDLLEELHGQAERERLLVEISHRIRQVLDLDVVLNTSVQEVRRLLKTDRVVLYQFQPDWSGSIVVESVASEWMSTLHSQIHDPCFGGQELNQIYNEGWLRAVSDIYDGSLNPCYVRLLEQFQVRANLVVPIIYENNYLWGLLIAHHCSGPRNWQHQDLDLVQKLSIQIALAIHQAQLYQKLQTLNTGLESQVQQRTLQLQQALDSANVLRRITSKIRDTLDEDQILQTAVDELAQVMQSDYCCTSSYNVPEAKAIIEYESSSSSGSSHLHQEIDMGSFGWVYHRLLLGKPFVTTTGASSPSTKGSNPETLTPDTPTPAPFDLAPLSTPQKISQFSRAEPGDQLCPRPNAGLAASLICPIADNQGILGDVGIFYSSYRAFDQAEIDLVQQVANQCAIAIRQARLYQTAQLQVSELEKLNRLKDDFLSTVSHELRTPMSNIKMAVQLLKKVAYENTNPRQQQYLNILESECTREIELINDLLDLQKLEEDSLPIEPTEIDLEIFVHQLCSGFMGKMTQREQQLDVDIAPNLSPFRSDYPLLSRLLTELITNAGKYSPPGSRIQVRIQPATAEVTAPDELAGITAVDQAIAFSVTNPVEIAADEIENIFHKFYRIPNMDPWKQGGTGLGLALVKKGIEQLQGSLKVTSQAGSTTFLMILPRCLPRCAKA